MDHAPFSTLCRLASLNVSGFLKIPFSTGTTRAQLLSVELAGEGAHFSNLSKRARRGPAFPVWRLGPDETANSKRSTPCRD